VIEYSPASKYPSQLNDQKQRVIVATYNLLNERLLESGYVNMDETPVQVLEEPDKKAESKIYMWVQKTGDPNKKESIVLFDYASSRKADVVKTPLLDFKDICKHMIMRDITISIILKAFIT
jgi:hypothetical protein